MINVKNEKIFEVIKTIEEVKDKINKQHTKLQMGFDGLFLSLLLIKKKKYAAVKGNLNVIIFQLKT